MNGIDYETFKKLPMVAALQKTKEQEDSFFDPITVKIERSSVYESTSVVKSDYRGPLNR
jgi:hypothetical protein